MEKNNNFNGDVKFFEEQEAKHKAFFENINSPQADEKFFEDLDKKFKEQEHNLQNPKPDEDFLAKHKAFFEENNTQTTTPDTKTSSGNSGMLIAQVDDKMVSAVVNSLKEKGINISPKEIVKMVSQHSKRNYTPEQIIAIVEVDCELIHAKKQENKQQNGMTM